MILYLNQQIKKRNSSVKNVIKVDDLDKHLKSFTHEKKVNPPMRVFDEVYGSLNQHQSCIILRCKICDEEIKYINRYRHIKSLSHREKEQSYDNDEIEVFKASLRKKINTIRFYNKKGFKTQIEFFNYFKDKIIEFINNYLDELNSIKIKLILKVQFKNINTNNEINHFLHSKYSSVFKSNDISHELNSHIREINKKINDSLIENDSGWTLNKIYHSDLYIDKYPPINASSYIDLPRIIKNKKAVINVKNTNDNECFKWSILSAIHQVEKDPQRLSKYIQFKDELSFNNINFPVKYDDYKRFESQNNHISINVFEYEIINDKLIINPIYITKEEKTNHVDLLMISNAHDSVIEEETNNHYCWIKDFEKLVVNQISKNEHKLFICKRCLLHFYSQENIDQHKIYCNQNQPQRLITSKDDYIEFKNIKSLQKIPFVIYVDFESILKKLVQLNKILTYLSQNNIKNMNQLDLDIKLFQNIKLTRIINIRNILEEIQMKYL